MNVAAARPRPRSIAPSGAEPQRSARAQASGQGRGRGLTTARGALAVCAVMTAVVLAWHRVIGEMWLRWLPAWNETGAAWSERWLGGEGYYHHGPWVPLVSGAMLWAMLRRGELRASPCIRSTLCGAAMVAAGVAALTLSRLAGVTFTAGFALPPTLLGAVLIAGGWPAARAAFAPLALLAFMVPIPLVAVAHLNYELKLLAAQAAVALANLAPDAAFALHDSRASWGGPVGGGGGGGSMMIGEACSGLRGLITMTWVAAVLAARRGLTWGARGALLAAAVPAAIALNAVRVAALLLLARALGVEAVAPETTLHEAVGVAAFVGGVGGLIALDLALRKVFVPSGGRPRDAAPRAACSAAPPRRLPLWGAAALLALAAAIATLEPPSHAAPSGGFADIPRRVAVGGRVFTGVDRTIPASLTDHLGRPAVLHRRFTHTPSGRAFDLHVVRHTGDRRALHPPEVCMRGGGVERLDRTVAALPNAAGTTLRVVSLTARRGDTAAAVRYAYQGPSGYTTAMLRHQAGMFLGSLLGRPHSGAIVRIEAPLTGPHDAPGRALADRAAARLMPAVEAAFRGGSGSTRTGDFE